MAKDEDDATPDAVAELARLKPAVERLRGLLQAAAVAEEAADRMDVPAVAVSGELVGGESVEGSAQDSEPSPTPGV